MPVHRLTSGEPYGVEIRPGSSVQGQVAGDNILLTVHNESRRTPQSMVLVVPFDVAARLAMALHVPELAGYRAHEVGISDMPPYL